MKFSFAGWFFFGALASAQPAVDANRLYEIQGQVVDADTGAPISRAQVSMTLNRVGIQSSQPSEAHMVLTDGSGAFHITNVPTGYANLSCNHSGYFGPDAPHMAGTTATLINRKESTVPVTLYLRRDAVIRGTAHDERGFASRGTVQVYRLGLVDGRMTPQQVASAGIDVEGDFRLSGLRPGRYYVAYFPNSYPARPMQRAYRAVIYPGSYDLAGARIITLNSGDDQQIDFRPDSEPSYEISGKIPTGAENFFISVHPLEVDGLSSSQPLGSLTSGGLDRTFRVSVLPSGQYVLKAQWLSGGVWIHASKRIALNGGNARDVILEISAQNTLPITLTYDSAANSPLRGFIQLVSRTGTFPVSPDEDGKLRIGQLAPGVYAVLAQGFGYVKSALQGRRDALRDGVLVPEEGSPEPLEVVIGNQSASFETTLDQAIARPGEMVKIALLRQIPVGWHVEEQTAIQVAQRDSAPSAGFARAAAFRSIARATTAPGDYIVMAWTGDGLLTQIPYNEPGFLERYASVIERPTLGDSGRQTVVVRHLLPASAFDAH